MSKYTTGEVAKLCGVTVRTVQYYDTRGILTPSELSEGGRRLYSDEDVRMMKIICFLRDLGLPINAISQLLAEEDPESVIGLMIAQQEKDLKREVSENEEKLRRLADLKEGLKNVESFSVESIGDIAYKMTSKKKMKKFHMTLLAIGIPIALLQVAGIWLWIAKGSWWLFAVWAAAAIPFGILASRAYYRKVSYICPQCHTVFKPRFKEVFFAAHTPSARKLTCSSCGHKGYCVEVIPDDAEV